ncbi:MAG: protein kinase [Gemmatimonadota bacterium]|nr:protein kinase [Gemmatimonadota bacterium]
MSEYSLAEQLRTDLEGRYEIERELGSGGMATVYLAHDLRHDRQVALKVMHPGLAAMVGPDRFLNEIKVTGNLQHPNILALYDSGEAAGTVFYVMPYIAGESLRQVLDRERQLSVDDTVELVKGIASALDFAHEQGVIHRDIKPENILLQGGKPIVADFGIALAVTSLGGRMTETGLSLGTAQYMSPEQASGDRDLDRRTDVYSLAATAYEMLVGRAPFEGASAHSVVVKILSDDPVPVSDERSSVPDNVDAAIMMGLSKLPADRFATVGAFANALTNPSFTTSIITGGRRHRARPTWKDRWAVPLAALAVVLAAVAVWALTREGAADRSTLRYRLLLPSEQSLDVRYGSRVALSPDGGRLVFQGPGAAGVQLWLRPRNSLDAAPLAGTDGAVTPFFSPAGDEVGFLNVGRGSLSTIALAGGATSLLLEGGVSPAGASWGENGIVYVDAEKGLSLVSPEDGTVTRLLDRDGVADPRWPQVLPGGRVLFTAAQASGFADYDIAILEPDAEEHRVLVRGVVGIVVEPGYLLYATASGELLAAPFDIGRGRLEPDREVTTIATGLDLQFGAVDLAASRSGTLIFATAGADERRSDLVWVDRDGAARPLDDAWSGDFRNLAISADGLRIAVGESTAGQRSDIWVKEVGRGQPTRVTFQGLANFRPEWMPDGRSVSYISSRDAGRRLYALPVDGSGGGPAPTGPGGTNINQAVWSSDGAWLVYRTGVTDSLDIYAIPAGGGDAVPVAADPAFDEHSPRLSPDGRWVTYVSNETGEWEVYVRPFPDPSRGFWLVSQGGGTEPRWSRDGSEIFYKSGGRLVAAGVETEGVFQIISRDALFSVADYNNWAFHARYDVAPDGRFLMIRSPAGTETFVVVENWLADLENREP